MTIARTLSASVVRTTHQVSVKGRMRTVDALSVDGHLIVIRGRALTVAQIFDAYWLEADALPDPLQVIEQLKAGGGGPDIFTFTQRVPDTERRYDFYCDFDNVAVIPVSSHARWLAEQVSPATRRNVRSSEKKGVVVRVCTFDEPYIRGIMAISNESPIRAGRKYWHYGKDFATIAAEQGTYRDRSTFLGAFIDDEMIGYLKLVWDRQSAAIMQIVSMMKHRDKRTNNALLSEAVRLCGQRGVAHLLYERFVYGDKEDSSLTRFKRENGFVRMNVPRYHAPLTFKGRTALALGLHKSATDRLPHWLRQQLIEVRDKWYARS